MAKNNQSKKKNNGSGTRKNSSEPLARGNQPGSEIAQSGNGSPFAFMRRFSEEMDRLFEDFGLGRGWLAPELERGLDRLGTLTTGTWAPQVEVLERDDHLIVRTDLPGMSRDDISVDIDNNSLVIRGERKSEREEDQEGYYRSERSYGSFHRRVPLPSGVSAETARADFRNGVLEISLPIAQRTEEKRRQLQITGETETQPRAKARAAGQK